MTARYHSRVLHAAQLTEEMLTEVDQVIVGTNRARHDFNRAIRQFKGIDRGGVNDWLPVKGDKLVCLKNDKQERKLINGSLWRVDEIDYGETDRSATEVVILGLIEEDNPAHKITARVPAWLFNTPDRIPQLDEWDMFTYAYAMTCHKCQGSEWDSVLVIDQRYVFAPHPERRRFRDDQWKWLYTALTRARKRVVVVEGWKKAYWAGLGVQTDEGRGGRARP